MQSIKITKKERRKLMKKLPPHWDDILSSIFECSPGHCRNVVSGHRKNDTILAEAVKMAAELQSKKAESLLLLKEVANAS